LPATSRWVFPAAPRERRPALFRDASTHPAGERPGGARRRGAV